MDNKSYKRIPKIFLYLYLASLLASCTHTQIRVTGATITEAGIYTAETKKWLKETGVIGDRRTIIKNQRLVKETTTIPAILGTRFGYRYAVSGSPLNEKITLRMVWNHPAITNPATGRSTSRSEYKLSSWVGETYTSFKFHDEWEIATGVWKSEIWYQGKKLAEQAFNVVPVEN